MKPLSLLPLLTAFAVIQAQDLNVQTVDRRALNPPTDFDRARFQVFNPELASAILGDSPTLTQLVYSPGYAFAHEAPVYFPDEDAIYFCSDAGGPLGRSNATTNNKVFKAVLSNLEAKAGNATFEEDVEEVVIDNAGVQMTNGGTNYDGKLLLVNSGRTLDYPGSLALVDRSDPKSVQVLLNNVVGKQFSAPNDVVVHPVTGAIFFTDAWYAQTQLFRPYVELPLSVWRLDPNTGAIQAMTDPSMVKVPNGLAFSPDGSKMYVADTGAAKGGDFAVEGNATSSIYEFDLVQSGGTQRLSNRRVFSWVQTGIADGIKVDTEGNVYSATGDGVQVWTKDGEEILKIFLPQGSVNLAFANDGRLVITSNERIWLAKIKANGPALWELPSK
ncbi:calcium-dependent phosphotriesterase [Violaceomyces palustris]|uniref:Calcium-dependent phosphotriesterase n=1 Tax=Violaceomyces palustris TaxID=1673888 RepID=A0ACD0NQH5_9BASI|nr:calcium-dependent phosphotriesterase [Violaceomyces palustris]